jgi:hypothetical protein
MRIVHDIEAPATVSAGGEPYARSKDATKSHSWRVNLTIVAQDPFDEGEEGEVIHIEGGAEYVLDVLKEAVMQIELLGTMYVEDGAVEDDWATIEDRQSRRAKP